MKPTLIVHSYFSQYVSDPLVMNDILRVFATVQVHDRMETRDAKAFIVYNDTTILKKTLILEKYHKSQICKNDTFIDDCSLTTYQVPQSGTKMYNVVDKAPRFLLWLDNTYEHDVCCTAMYKCSNITRLPIGVAKAIHWARKYASVSDYAIRNLSVVVFDLDQTLIDDNRNDCKILDNCKHVLSTAREHYDFIVLWSHGSSLHVNTYVSRLNFTFDLVLSSNDYGKNAINCKNLLHLYNYISVDYRITYAILIDDSPYNWTPEYDMLIVPIRGIRNILPISHLLYQLKF